MTNKIKKTVVAVTDYEEKIVHLSIKMHSDHGVGEEKVMCMLGEEIEVPTPAGFGEWLIWSNEHNAWWAPKNNGYVRSRAKAGRYSFEEASMIVEGANRHRDDDAVPNEAMILDEQVVEKNAEPKKYLCGSSSEIPCDMPECEHNHCVI